MQLGSISTLCDPPSWTRLTRSWSEPEARGILSKTPPVSLSLGPQQRLLVSTECSLLALQPGVETKTGAAKAIKSQAVRLLAELFGWVQQNPRVHVHGNDGSNCHMFWSPAGCTGIQNLHELHCCPDVYGAVLLTLLDSVADAKDAALAAAAYDQLLAVPGG